MCSLSFGARKDAHARKHTYEGKPSEADLFVVQSTLFVQIIKRLEILAVLVKLGCQLRKCNSTKVATLGETVCVL